MTKILFLSVVLMFTALNYADSRKDKHNPEDAVSQKTIRDGVLEEMGYWKREDCLKISGAAGMLLYYSGELLKESEEQRKSGEKRKLEKTFKSAHALSEVAANFAKNFETFCK